LLRVRAGRRRRLPRGGPRRRRGDRRLHVPGAPPGVLRAPRRAERRPQGLHRRLLPARLRRAARTGPRDARVPAPRDRPVVRDHDAADRGAQRRRRRARPAHRVGRRAPRARRPAALHRLPPRLQDDRRPPHAARDADPGPGLGAAQRAAPRLHRQRARPRGLEHLVPGLRCAAHRARLVRARPLAPHRLRAVPDLRPPPPRPLRGPARHVGAAARPRPDRRRLVLTVGRRAVTSDAAARPGAGATRPPAVAGLFYPADADDLRAAVDRALAAAPVVEPDGRPRAVIAPHAGYRYSGATAGAAYRAVAADAEWVERVAVVGPAHRVPVGGVGVGATTAARWETPLGPVDVDVDAVGDLVACGLAVPADEAHAPEHSVEVHLPFLQRVLPGRPVVPLVVGRAPHVRVAAALERLWDDRTLVVVSSDLSHYLDEATARARDERTRRAILEGRHGDIGAYDACGCVAIGGLLVAARPRRLVARTLAMTTSAAASGDTSRV